MKVIFFLLLSLLVSYSAGSKFLGLSSYQCAPWGGANILNTINRLSAVHLHRSLLQDCHAIGIISIDTISGTSTNISFLPSDIHIDKPDLIHLTLDLVNQQLLLLYVPDIYPNPSTRPSPTLPSNRPTSLLHREKAIIIPFDLQSGTFSPPSPLNDKVRSIFSTCHWPGEIIYGLAWMEGESPNTLTVFSFSTDSYEFNTITTLPGSYITLPDCAFNPDTNMLYFYSRNVGELPRTLNIWEVDIINSVVSTSWSLNGTDWSQAYLLQYNPPDNRMYGIVADGKLNTWIVSFNETSQSPFSAISQTPDQLSASTVVAYDKANAQFVYILQQQLVAVGIGTTITRTAISGTPDHAIRRIVFEGL